MAIHDHQPSRRVIVFPMARWASDLRRLRFVLPGLRLVPDHTFEPQREGKTACRTWH